MIRQTMLATVAVLLPMAAQAGTELITNGNFEDTTTTASNGNFQVSSSSQASYGSVAGWGTYAYTSNGSTSNPYNILFRTTAKGDTSAGNANQAETTDTQYSPTNAGSGALTLWGPSTGASREYLASGFNKASPTGGNFVALDGDSAYRGYLYQQVTGLAAGTAYQLVFYWAAAKLNTGAAAPDGLTESLAVIFGSSIKYTDTVKIADNGFSGWIKQTMTFVADSSSAYLAFLSVGTPNGAPPLALLDGVSLMAVPEPASLALVGGAVAGLGFLRRRSARARAGA